MEKQSRRHRPDYFPLHPTKHNCGKPDRLRGVTRGLGEACEDLEIGCPFPLAVGGHLHQWVSGPISGEKRKPQMTSA